MTGLLGDQSHGSPMMPQQNIRSQGPQCQQPQPPNNQVHPGAPPGGPSGQQQQLQQQGAMQQQVRMGVGPQVKAQENCYHLKTKAYRFIINLSF